MATSGEANTGICTSEQVHSVDNKDVYWQIGKNAMDSMLNLYEKQLWTDVSIRCSDHVTDDPDDRLRAHKVILAARSPVFSAMFYGPTSNGNNDLDLTEYGKASVDAFLRYLYCDFENLLTDIVIDVFKLAHFYQVSTLVERCCDVLSSGLTTENACTLLEMAMVYDMSVLKECIIDFIDEHVHAVLESEGFLSISNDTLEYLLKGDTLFADEVVIVTHVYRWASNKLSALNKKVNMRNVRELLGRSSFLLRIPRMSLEEFLKLESQYCFHTRKECVKIAYSFATGKHQELSSYIQEKRVAKAEHVSFTNTSSYTNFYDVLKSIIRIQVQRSVTVSAMTVKVPPVAVEYCHSNSYGHVSLKCSCPFQIRIECQQTAFEQVKTITSSEKEVDLRIDPPLLLEGSDNNEYTLQVTVNCPMIPKLCFKACPNNNKIVYISKSEDCPKVTVQKNQLVSRLSLSQSSGRNRNVAESVVNVSKDTYYEESDGEFESECVS